MKRLLQGLATGVVSLMLAMPFAAFANTYDAGGFRWSYDVYDNEDGSYEAYIYDVWQIDGNGNTKEWDATSLTVPATLPATWTNEFARAERVAYEIKYDGWTENGYSNKYVTAYGPEIKSVVATVTELYVEADGWWEPVEYYDEEYDEWYYDEIWHPSALQGKLTSLVIPETVEWVSGFYDCTNLTTVTMGAETRFGHGSFYGTPWLKGQGEFVIRNDVLIAYQGTATAVTVPDGVIAIGESAFDTDYNEAMTNLTSVTLPASLESIGVYAFYGCKKLAAIINMPDSVTQIGNYAFEYCESLSEVPLSADLKSIGRGAFSGCQGLTRVALPATLKYLGDGAFGYCTNLTSVTLPAGLKSLNGTFRSCYNLTSVTLPTGLEYINNSAFAYCEKLTSITLPAGLKSINSYAFESCTNLTSVTLPAGLESIGYYAFARCEKLASIAIPASVTSIGSSAFYSCTGLTTVTGGEGLEEVDSWAFNETPFYNNIENGIFKVGSIVLSYKGTLPETLTIPEGVRKIRSSAFYGNGNFKTLNLPSSLKEIGGNAFGWTSVSNVTGGAGLEKIGDYAFNGSPYGNTFQKDRGNAKETFALMRLGGVVAGYKGVCPTEIVIPNDVKCLAPYLFYRWYDATTTNITTVVVGSGVTTVGTDAFYDAENLTTVTFAGALKNVGSSAFAYCSSLKTLTIPGPLESLGGGAFYGCTGLTDLTLTGSHLYFYEGTFRSCTNLVNITVNLVEPETDDDEDEGEAYLSVESGAFLDCDKLASFTVTRPGFQITGWSTWGGAMEEEFEFPDELNTFRLYRMYRHGNDYDVGYCDFTPVWKRVLRNAEADGAFDMSVATTYLGWIDDADGNVAGSITLKVQKGKDGVAKATASVAVVGGRKVSVKGTFDANGIGQGDLAGLVLGANGLSGTLKVAGVSYVADGARDVTKTRKDAEIDVLTALNKKVWTVVLAPQNASVSPYANGYLGFSVTMGSKGKAKIVGTLPDGARVNVSAQTIVGGVNCCIPVIYSKPKDTLGFLVWVDREGNAVEVTGISDWKSKVSGEFAAKLYQEEFEALAPITADADFHVYKDDVPESLEGVLTSLLPRKEPITITEKKWTVNKAATVKFVKGAFDTASYEKGLTQGKTNNSGLKVKYTPKTGVFSGSFKVFADEGGRLKKYTATVNGVVCDGVGYGAALIKKQGTMPVVIGEED